MKTIKSVRFKHIEDAPPGATQGIFAQVRGALLSVVVGLEPANDDGSYCVHVSVSHKYRSVTDDELKAVGDELFNGKEYFERNCIGSKARHLWEKNR